MKPCIPIEMWFRCYTRNDPDACLGTMEETLEDMTKGAMSAYQSIINRAYRPTHGRQWDNPYWVRTPTSYD